MYQNLETENQLVIDQKWESEALLHRFLRSNTYFKIIELIELSRQPPEILFNTISNIGGVEVVEALRG